MNISMEHYWDNTKTEKDKPSKNTLSYYQAGRKNPTWTAWNLFRDPQSRL
jgi:hypothetical protein